MRGLRSAAGEARLRLYNAGVRVRLLAFASAADALGADEREVVLDAGTTVGALRLRLAVEHPALVALLPRLAIAVDGEVAGDATVLSDGAEVALLPPVSGGGGEPPPTAAAARAWLTDESLDAGAVAARVSGADCGALVLFVGTVRERHEGQAVVRLGYSAYAAMAERRLLQIAEELASKHAARLAVAHRLGTLLPGETSVVIAVAAPHREAAYAANRECLERLKREVPIWKREHYADGDARWREEEAL